MLVSWIDNSISVAENFTITLTAAITNMNAGSPFKATKSFKLIASAPICDQSLDVPTIMPTTLSNKAFIWT